MSTCKDLRDALQAGREPSPPMLEHAGECEPCAELLFDGASLGKQLGSEAANDPSEQALAQLLSGLKSELSHERGLKAWLRSRPSALRAALLFGVIGSIGLLHVGRLLRPDAAVYPAGRLGLELCVLGLIAIASVVVGLRPYFKTNAPLALTVGVAAIAVLTPVVSIALGPAHTAHDASLAGVGHALLPRAFGCLMYGLVFALPVGLVAWLVDRGPAARSAVPFAGAATIGANLALWLHCPITHGSHIALGHVPLGFCLFAAALLVWRYRPRRA